MHTRTLFNQLVQLSIAPINGVFSISRFEYQLFHFSLMTNDGIICYLKNEYNKNINAENILKCQTNASLNSLEMLSIPPIKSNFSIKITQYNLSRGESQLPVYDANWQHVSYICFAIFI